MNPIRLLIVEDDPNDRHVLQHVFSQTGKEIQLETCHDGEAAQERLARSIAPGAADPLPELVMLDIRLPKLTGLELLQWMKQTPPLDNVPVVILSGVANPSDIDDAHELDVNIYLAKDDDIAAWERMANAVVAFVEAHREEPAATITT